MMEGAVRGLGNFGGGYIRTISIVLRFLKNEAGGVGNMGVGYMGD